MRFLWLVGFLWVSVAFAEPMTTEALYKKPSDAEIKKRLSELQYRVTQQDATETPYANEYWDLYDPGIYVDVVSGEPLFSSLDKYKSNTGWPSFTSPLVPENIVRKVDWKLGVKRTEVRSKNADSHLGHVFDDGPMPSGKRYCINSASLRFIPASDLEGSRYQEFTSLFTGITNRSHKMLETSKPFAILGGGCFWCVEEAFDQLDGVLRTVSGYFGGTKSKPSYQEVAAGKTSYVEVVRVEFDPEVLSYSEVVSHFWKNIDPLSKDGQFCDRGKQYRSVIYAVSDEQFKLASESKDAIAAKPRFKDLQIETEVLEAGNLIFHAAEEYHQNYHQKNPIRYRIYKARCGRSDRLEEIWGAK